MVNYDIDNYLSFFHLNSSHVFHKENHAVSFLYPCSSSFQCSPINITLKKGRYLLEVWGAKGGDGLKSFGGKGGYSRGELVVNSELSLYLYIGGQGESYCTTHDAYGGSNGGGKGKLWKDELEHGGGGGSTDFRLTDLIYTRIIVAGGGGGCGGLNQVGFDGGSGGGFSGEKGHSNKDREAFSGTGATNKTFGLKGCDGNLCGTDGSFFQGGNGHDGSSTSGSGGGGYFGGGGGHCSSAGGGSGFVSTIMKNRDSKSGSESFYNWNNERITGNNGDGFAKITLISNYIIRCTFICRIPYFYFHFISQTFLLK